MILKCACGKTLTDLDVCPLPVGRPCKYPADLTPVKSFFAVPLAVELPWSRTEPLPWFGKTETVMPWSIPSKPTT
jgi:hypothetical protein